MYFNKIIIYFTLNIKKLATIILFIILCTKFYLNKKVRIAIVAIGKLENHYIKEWVEHYYNLGVDKIFLYDNNDINGEKFEDEINEYIKKGFVEIIDYRGRKPNQYNLQSQSYLDCYQNRVNDFDYMGIFDIDEFLDLGNNVKLYDYISQYKFKKCQCIKFPWLMMDDNDLITVENNNYSLKTRFTKGRFLSFCNSIFRTSFNQINSTKVIFGHGPIGLISCDPDGNNCFNGSEKGIDPSNMYRKPKITKEYVRHYSTKTLQEYIEIKMKRLYASRTPEDSKKRINLKTFFKYNKLTDDKLNYLKKKGLYFNLNYTN